MQHSNDRQNMTMEDDYNPHQMNEGDDVELDNRIKELLLSSHNLFLVTQLHEKEIKEIGPIIKELPKMLGKLSREAGEKGDAKGNNGGNTEIGRGLFIGCILGSSFLTAVITALLVKVLFS